ncbi:MAG TPA: NAD-dependent epimerase/dehydratase family protein [Thermoleophilaceae bacterium]|nr:NAD-dependent epimerase/dehydratase family protein [Thermoleophilaceae bacterium]
MPSSGLTVAVTGPTGDLGIAIVNALERSRAVHRVVGMARRPFDPGARGWRKTEYRQGDVTDSTSVRELAKGANVVVHLAFAIVSASDATRDLNVEGSRRVFEEAAKAGAERICYASSVAAYGFHDDNPDWLTEEVPARGSPEHPYSQQKAEVERVLADVLQRRRRTVAYAFRPCIVAGPEAQMMLEEIPFFRLSEAMPDAVARLLGSLPVLKPVIPDPGTPFQLVHEDDVASAFSAGVRGLGEPGPYNLAGAGTLTMSDLADALDWYSLRVPRPLVEATAEIATRLPLMPDSVAWIHSVKKPVLMKTDRAKRLLRWRPKHTASATLKQMVAVHRAELRAR